jgi:hypothetical protein
MAPKTQAKKKPETAETKPAPSQAAPSQAKGITPSGLTKLNIHQRVLAVIDEMAKAGGIARESISPTQSYRFASHNAIKEALTPLLTKYGILHVMKPTAYESGSRVQPGSTYTATQSQDSEVYWVRIKWEMQLINTENPSDAIIVGGWPGYAEDYADQAESKAITLAEKTFLVKQFKITTTDDETASGIDKTRARRPQRPALPILPVAPVHPVAPAARPEAAVAKSETVSAPVTAAAVTSAAVTSPTASAPPATPPRRPVVPEARVASSAPAAQPAVAPEATLAVAPATLTEEALLRLALPNHLPEAAIKVKIHNGGLKEAARWVGQNHRRNCPQCANFNQISLMIAAHPAESGSEPKKDDLPPLAE